MTTKTATKEIEKKIKAAIGLKGKGRIGQTSAWALDTIYRVAYNGENVLPRHYGELIYGIKWAVETGRTSSELAIAIERKLSVHQIIRLVAELAFTDIDVCGNVPSWLNSHKDEILSWLAE